jgi:predicted GNAT family N-acyltransferase
VELYARGGYEQVGEPFVEEGIDHVTMERSLA